MTSTARLRALGLAALIVTGALLAGPAAVGAWPSGGAVRLRAGVQLVPGTGATLHYKGTCSGPPLGRCNVDLQSRMDGAGIAHVTFVMSTARGSLRGSGDVNLTFVGQDVITHGRAWLGQGTGAYRGMHANPLRVFGRNPMNSLRSTVTLTGRLAG